MFRKLRSALVRGLVVVLPIGFTVWLLWWIGSSTEALLQRAILLVVPAQAMRSVVTQLSQTMKAGTPLIACAKGIEHGTHKFMTEIIAECTDTAVPAIVARRTGRRPKRSDRRPHSGAHASWAAEYATKIRPRVVPSAPRDSA